MYKLGTTDVKFGFFLLSNCHGYVVTCLWCRNWDPISAFVFTMNKVNLSRYLGNEMGKNSRVGYISTTTTYKKITINVMVCIPA